MTGPGYSGISFTALGQEEDLTQCWVLNWEGTLGSHLVAWSPGEPQPPASLLAEVDVTWV